MVGKLDVRYNLPDNSKLKSRFVTPEGKDFTKALRKSIELSVLDILNTNSLSVRTLIEKNLKNQGFDLKKECYQKDLDTDSKNILRCIFGTKENLPEVE